MNSRVREIIKRIFPNATPTYVKKFRKGVINETYDIKIKNRFFVLRIYPRDFWKIKKEEYVYNLIRKKTEIPVPRVILRGKNYALTEKIQGNELPLDNKALIRKAGELLAKLHSIKFPSYGWIIGDEIKPKFGNWFDFITYDLNQKLRKLPKKHKLLKAKIRNIIYANKSLFDIKSKPCLLHKDYHPSHILVHKNKINGIIDVEWATAGHNEMDIVKSCMWMFENKADLEKIFLQGYKKYGKVSKEFSKRKRLYKLLILLSSLSFSYECKNKKWCIYNLKKLEGELN